MTITIQVPATLRAYSGCDLAELSVSAETLRAALEKLERSHPEIYRGVCDDSGAIRRHVNVFINSTLVSGPNGIDWPLKSGDVLAIMPAVSGG